MIDDIIVRSTVRVDEYMAFRRKLNLYRGGFLGLVVILSLMLCLPQAIFFYFGVFHFEVYYFMMMWAPLPLLGVTVHLFCMQIKDSSSSKQGAMSPHAKASTGFSTRETAGETVGSSSVYP